MTGSPRRLLVTPGRLLLGALAAAAATGLAVVIALIVVSAVDALLHGEPLWVVIALIPGALAALLILGAYAVFIALPVAAPLALVLGSALAMAARRVPLLTHWIAWSVLGTAAGIAMTVLRFSPLFPGVYTVAESWGTALLAAIGGTAGALTFRFALLWDSAEELAFAKG